MPVIKLASFDARKSAAAAISSGRPILPSGVAVTNCAFPASVASHAHLDHVFGTLSPDGSQVFPNARYVIGEQEWTYWMQPDIKLGNLLPDEWKQTIVEGAKRHLGGIKDRVEFVKPAQEVVTGIIAVEAFGHTPGMLAFNISSGSGSPCHSLRGFDPVYRDTVRSIRFPDEQ